MEGTNVDFIAVQNGENAAAMMAYKPAKMSWYIELSRKFRLFMLAHVLH